MSPPSAGKPANPFKSKPQGPALLRLDPGIPFRWRRVPLRLAQTLKLRYQQDGRQEFSRWDFGAFLAGISDRFQPGNPARENPLKRPLLSALADMESKLDLVFSLVGRDNPARLDDQRPVAPISFGGHQLVFWERAPGLTVGDLLEVQFTLFQDRPLWVRCLVRVAQLGQDEKTGLIRVTCRVETLGGKLRVRGRPLPRASKPAAVVQSIQIEPESIPDLEEPPPPPEPAPRPVPAPEPVAPVPARAVALPSAAAAASIDVGEFRDYMISGQSSAGPDGDEGSNRRQAFRVNDEVMFSWKVVAAEEVEDIHRHLADYRQLRPRPREERFAAFLIAIRQDLASLPKSVARTGRTLGSFLPELDMLFRRANHPNEEGTVIEWAECLRAITAEMAARPESVTNRFAQGTINLRQRLDQMKRILELEDRAPVTKQEEGRTILARIDRELSKSVAEIGSESPVLGEQLALFLEIMDRLRLPKGVPTSASGRNQPGGGLVKTQVNLSATGIAFKVASGEVARGDYLQIALELTADGTTFNTHEGYARVVMAKQPAPGRPLRVACQFMIVTKKMEDELSQHIVFRQREELAARSKVRGVLEE
ncbi:MAG: PilZ domain-containing protein [Magnetococcales bacterium]|nr:PilZ domain-containing protein [Magnetococcales bacterium]